LTADTEGPPRLHWGWVVALGILIAGFTSIALDTVFHFKDSPIDGPFQLYNGLRRLAIGERYGGTFQVFHGPGIPYLHYPLFRLFGGSFLASEFSRQVVSVGASMLVLPGFFRAWTDNWRSAIQLSVIALLGLVMLRVHALSFPINSMIGLRSTMPLVVGMHLVLRPHGWRAAIERGGVLAITLACGIEQGMASMAALGAVLFLVSLLRRERRPCLEAIVAVASGVAFYVVIVAIISRDPVSVLRYNFSLVPRDQFWYFGGPPNTFLSRPIQLLIFLERPLWTLMVIVAVIVTAIRFFGGTSKPDARFRIAEFFLTVYALVSATSMLGTLAMVYFQPAVRVALLLAVIAVWRWLQGNRAALHVRPWARRHGEAILATLVTLFAISMFPLATFTLVRTPFHVLASHLDRAGRPQFSEDWRATARVGEAQFDRTAAVVGHKPVLWSTYSSLIESDEGVFNPSYDYIIHALGPAARADYAATFVSSRPDLVQTLDPTYASYEEWLELHHWNFYRPLLRDYHVTAVGPWSYFWTRDSVPFDERPELVAIGAVPAGRLGIAFDAGKVPKDSIGLFEVSLYYHTSNPLAKLPVIGNLPRYLVQVDGAANHIPVSLAPYATEKVFPVVTNGPTQVRLTGAVASITRTGSLVFDSIRVERLRISPRNDYWARAFVHGYVYVPDTTATP
jgi:hypothetical protein